ncbi:MAG: nucleoside 2-deoxyribosyltransferase [Proteobacteria bacterium]|nr:nucleoside 2-deoxyribosyltransferase [Pseudomonadota bacterium]
MSSCYLCGGFDGSRVETHTGAEGALVECPRCGRYDVDERVLKKIRRGEHLAEHEGLRLSALARRKSDSAEGFEGRLRIREGERAVQELLKAAPRLPAMRATHFDIVLLGLADLAKHVGDVSVFKTESLAARAMLPKSALNAVLRELHPVLIELGQEKARLTHDGWRRVDELGGRATGDKAFVAMSFNEGDPRLWGAYEAGIRPALTECGFRPPFRVDDAEHHEPSDGERFRERIDDRFLAMIRASRVVIVDATDFRLNVAYEAGFAEGLGIERVWTCHAADVSGLPFDTRQIEQIVWEEPEELRERLVARIKRRGLSRVL